MYKKLHCSAFFNMDINKPSKKFVYGKCNQAFNQSSGLSRHKRNSKSCGACSKKMFQCNTCSKLFTRNDSLIKHVKGRCKTPGFPCDQCEKTFISSWFLKRHAVVHEETATNPCENCEKTYSRKKLYLFFMCFIL